MRIAATYFDGRTSRLYRVLFSVEGEVACIISSDDAGLALQFPLAELRVSERNYNAPRKVSFPDGAYVEISDHTMLNALLHDSGHRDSWVVRMQQSWRGTLAAVVATVLIIVVGYLYGIPWAANGLAQMVPVSVEHRIGKGVLEFWDGHLLAPSKLPVERQRAILEQFHALRSPSGTMVEHNIVFRHSKMGPNAFALPSGDIVLTDEIVALVNDDQAVLGILAHELGHLAHRHLMRRLIQTSTIAAATTVVFGDASAIVANIPTVMADMKYSRDAETEADDYAIALLKYNGIALSHLSQVFEKLSKKESAEAPLSPYLSSHPASAERMARIKAAE